MAGNARTLQGTACLQSARGRRAGQASGIPLCTAGAGGRSWRPSTASPAGRKAALDAAVIGFQAWRTMRGGGNDERRQILDKLAGFLERHGDSRFSDWTADGAAIRDRAGWWKPDDAGGRLYLFNADGLREALKGFDFKRAEDVAAEPVIEMSGNSLTSFWADSDVDRNNQPESGGGQLPPMGKACPDCQHFARPGKSDGYCSGRDDLPLAYGENHPLRRLPADRGASCDQWQASE
jgi:hypothetical protein